MAGASNEHRHRRIVHPVYLDVPMMTSFLAALRDGVAFEDTILRREGSVETRERGLAAKVGLPALGSLMGLDASGRVGRKDEKEASEEVTAVRQHTTASLFNALYGTLGEEDLLRQVGSELETDEIAPGELVEVGGAFVGNPIEPVVALARQAAPYFDMSQEAAEGGSGGDRGLRAELAVIHEDVAELSARASRANRSGNPAMKAQAVQLREQAEARRVRQREVEEVIASGEADRIEQEAQELGFRMLNQVGIDLESSPVHDTVINAGALKVVLTMSAEFFTDATSAYLRGGTFRAVGKVTRVLGGDESINLLRRTVLGGVDPEVGRNLITEATKDKNLHLDTFDPVIEAPAIQVLPLAVFT